MTTTPSYPMPREDADNAAFLAGWKQGRLVIQTCAACSKTFFYPRAFCPRCWSDRIEAREASGKGHIVSYSLVHRPNDPAFNDEVPIALVEVKLAEGATLISRVIDARPEEIRSGRSLILPPPEVGARYPLPVFRLAGGKTDGHPAPLP
jgi:uncharacterized OB-fold protein